MISIIAAVSQNNVIGGNNKLLWNLPNDLKHFKKITNGNVIIMGRKTFESIGKPLPNRRNIVISSSKIDIVDIEVVSTIDIALKISNNNCFIIGGGQIYKQTIDIADKLFITKIHESFEGDTYFPFIDTNKWNLISIVHNNSNESNIYHYDFLEYDRVK